MTTKVPAELSSTPGIVDNSNATAITIDSNEKIIIGDTASHVDDLLQIETPASGGGHGIQIRRNDSNTDQGIGRILFGNNTDTDLATISAKTDGANDSGALTFSTQATGGSSSEKLRILSSGGITFNGDTAAANALDDYEEGTFTPTVTSGITSVGYSAQTGYYTRIGNLVLFNLRVVTSSGNAQSSTFAVGNLPFNSAATQQPGGAAIRAYASSFSGSASQAFIGPASNSISFFTLSGTAFAGTSITDHDGFDLRITGIYRA